MIGDVDQYSNFLERKKIWLGFFSSHGGADPGVQPHQRLAPLLYLYLKSLLTDFQKETLKCKTVLEDSE
jgi:hypothetical protein